MIRAQDMALLLAAAGFVTSGMIKALFFRPAPVPPAPEISLGLPLELPVQQTLATSPIDLARIYLQPQNPVMWLLLAVLWGLLILDAVGGALEPREEDMRERIVPPLLLALLAGAAWPWIIEVLQPLGTALAVAMMLAAILAALRAKGTRRPAIGFLAGWSTGIAMAVAAGLIAAQLGLPVPETAALAILPSALIGMVAQVRIGRSISYSVALIWAFCGVAATSMGSNPVLALAAILGIAALTSVLIRAAS